MTSRLKFVLAAMLTLLVVFTGRLMYLQFAMAEELSTQSAQNFTEHRRISPLRGQILARDGTVLADNRIAVDLMYWGGEIEQWNRIRHMLGIKEEPRPPELSDPQERISGSVLSWNVPDDMLPGLKELAAVQPTVWFGGKQHPTLELRERIERTYPTNLAAQVIGYTTEAAGRFEGYAIHELVGRAGLELSFQDVLFGTPGAEIIKVNNRGVVLDRREIMSAIPGKDIRLTLDPRAQRIAEDVLKNALQYVNADRLEKGLEPADIAKGALVAINPNTGEILAMASVPSYNQNVFTKRPSEPEEVTELLTNNKTFPMSNRAVQAYPPASTFKVVTSSALLEYGYITPNSLYPCSANFRLGNVVWWNWLHWDQGNYNVTEALADSCNTFFWNAVADTPGALEGWGPFMEDLVTRARTLGYGHTVGVGLLEEQPGRIPDEEWAENYYQYGWLPGFTFNTVIGQGDVLATPLQVAQLISTVAMDGLHMEPKLIQAIGGVPTETHTEQLEGRFWHTLQQGMRMMVTQTPSGRKYLGSLPVKVAGKTGTSQTSRGGGYYHAWFMGYGPYEDPELAIAVFIEHGGSSSSVSLPVARDFFTAYWNLETETQ